MNFAPIFSADETVAFLAGKTRRVLRLHLPAVETSSDGFPINVKDSQKSLKPGAKFEWYVRNDLAAVNIYRAKLGDLIAEEFGFRSDENWMIQDLPAGFVVFTFQKGAVDDKGKLVIERQDSYLYGHQSGSRYRSPKEFLPHVIGLLHQNADSLSGHPRNIVLPHNPLFSCTCQHCAKKSRPIQSAMDRPEQISKFRSIAIRANLLRASVEAPQDLIAGAWRFRQGEIVWVFEAPRKPTDAGDLDAPLILSDPSDPDGIFGAGGRWFAGLIVAAPQIHNFEDFAQAYMDDRNRAHYRVQKCGADDYVKDYKLKNVLPWVKRPVKDDSRGIVIDHISEKVALKATKSTGAVACKIIAPAYDGAKIMQDLEGAWFGPEKIWIGDAVRIHKKNTPSDLSVWDPASHDLLIIRRLVLARAYDEIQGSEDTPSAIYLYFLGDILSKDHQRPIDPIPFQVPTYLENLGGDYGKWVACGDADGKPHEGTINTPFVLGRFYDPRIMQLFDAEHQTVDDRITIKGIARDRAATLGFRRINGEVVRPPVEAHRTATVASFPSTPISDVHNHQGGRSRAPFEVSEPQDSGDRQKRSKLY